MINLEELKNNIEYEKQTNAKIKTTLEMLQEYESLILKGDVIKKEIEKIRKKLGILYIVGET